MVDCQPSLLELLWGQVAERLVWSFGIVLVAELFGKRSGFSDAGEERSKEELVAQPAVEALAESVLPGAARRDEMGLWLLAVHGHLACQPGLQRMGDELRAIVASQETWRSALFEQPVQDIDHACCRHGGDDLNGQALAGIVVADSQHLEPAPSGGCVEDEVVRPDVVRALCHQRNAAGGTRRFALFADPSRDLQPLLFPDAMNPVRTRLDALASKAVMGFAAAATPLPRSERAQLVAQMLVVVWS